MRGAIDHILGKVTVPVSNLRDVLRDGCGISLTFENCSEELLIKIGAGDGNRTRTTSLGSVAAVLEVKETQASAWDAN